MSKSFVRIIGNHPHSGESGFIVVVDSKVKYKLYANGTKAYTVHLLNCPYAESCEVEQKNMRPIADPEVSGRSPRSGNARGRRV